MPFYYGLYAQRRALEFVQKAVGGEIFELETVKTYMEDHMKMIYEAKAELEKGIYPELKNYPDIDGYDTIILGFPNWLAYHNLIQCTQI